MWVYHGCIHFICLLEILVSPHILCLQFIPQTVSAARNDS